MASSPHWTCPCCTFHSNASAHNFCGMCGTRKTPEAESGKAGVLGSSNSSLEERAPKKIKLHKILPNSEQTNIETSKPPKAPQQDREEKLKSELKAVAIDTWGSGPKKISMDQSAQGFLSNAAVRFGSVASRLCADAAMIDYETIKDKENPKQMHYGFAPKAQSQWHWFFVAKRTLIPIQEVGVMGTKDEGKLGKKGRAYRFKIELDKFCLAQGKAQMIADGVYVPEDILEKHKQVKSPRKMTVMPKFTYGCNGAKLASTAIRKQTKLMQESLDDTEFARLKRSSRALSHKQNLRLNMRGSTKVFVDEHGKEHPYFGMPIGGSHDWLYQDAPFVETGLKTGRIVSLVATDVKWNELKVHKNRWALSVQGTLRPARKPGAKDPSGLPVGVKYEYQESLIIANQIATKLTPNSYHVALKGVQMPLPGATEQQREQSRRELLTMFISEYGKMK